MKKQKKVIVGISVGDIGGIGPEIILKCFSDSRVFDDCIPVVYASESVLDFYLKTLEIEGLELNILSDVNQLKERELNLVKAWDEQVPIEVGKQSNAAGACAYHSIKKAVEDLASNKIDVLVTAPIDKYSIQESGFNFPGHTEFLAHYANEEDYLMMLVGDDLKVAVVTGHTPIASVSGAITVEAILRKAKTLDKSLKNDFGITRPKIAVLGLNPHAGDTGKIGTQEKDVIIPALEKLQQEGLLAFGPFGADGFFGTAAYKKFDAVLAMYHDQGLIPFKTLCFENGVNFTAGLPIVRTSPDHGVAYDIAGKNLASPSSFRAAVYLAIDIYKKRFFEKDLKLGALVGNNP